MKPDLTILETIERYLTHQMSQTEKEDFESLIEQDKDLAKLVEESRHTKNWIQDYQKENLREEFTQLGKKLFEEDNSKINNRLRIPAWSKWVAAAIVIILVSVWIIPFLTNDSQLSDKEIAAKLFVQDPVGRSAMAEGIMDEIVFQYRSGNYDSVISLSQTIIDQDSNSQEAPPDIFLYLGSSYFNLDKLDEAISAFKKISPFDLPYEEGQWRLALSYLASNQREKAIEIFCQIERTQSHQFKKQTKNVLNRLEVDCGQLSELGQTHQNHKKEK